MIELELTIFFVTCVILTVFYEIDRENFFFVGIFATFMWFGFALYYFVSGVGFPMLSLFFHAIGFVYLLRIIVTFYKRTQQDRYGGDEEFES